MISLRSHPEDQEEDEIGTEGEEEEEDKRSASHPSQDPGRGNKMLFLILLPSWVLLLLPGLWCALGALESLETPWDPNFRTPVLRPIAPLNSSFAEFPSGRLESALTEGRDALLLLYAPWDKKASLHAVRNILSRLRFIFTQDDLSIAAVNCWNHRGSCYQRYYAENVSPSKRFISYPQWVYVPKVRPLKDPFKRVRFFNSEPGDASYEGILSFILRQRSPLRVWKNKEEWMYDRARFGGLALTAYFESRKEIREYVRSAELIANLDTRDTILPVGILLNKTLARNVLGVRRVKLFWWNGEQEISGSSPLNRSHILSWTKKSLGNGGQKYLAPELEPSASKSLLLDSWLNSGSGKSIIAFLMPQAGGRPFKSLSLLRETALLYFTTPEDFHRNKNGVKDLYEAFTELRMSEDRRLFKEEAICKGIFPQEMSKVMNPCKHSLLSNESLRLDGESRPLFGDETSIRASIASKKRSACISLAYKESDSECFSQLRSDPNNGLVIEDSMREELLGIHPGNKSLNFIFINSNTNHHLMRKLGLQDGENVIIQDLTQERIWKMESTRLSPGGLSQFIWDFHYVTDSLKTFRRSKNSLESCESPDLCIPEISAHQFEEIISEENLHVVVLHQTKSCYFCAAARRSLHESKRFLEAVDFGGPRIRFVTLDGSANDLSSIHTPPGYPSLVFYPAGDKTNSQAYPFGATFESDELKQFLVGNMTPDEALRVEAHWCGESCLKAKKSMLNTALNSVSLSTQKDFLMEFEEMKRLIALATSLRSNHESKYEFIKDFRRLTDGINED